MFLLRTPLVCLIFAAFLVPAVSHAEKFDWTPPTPAELAMTADPKAPEAPAVILSFFQTDNDNGTTSLIHVRIKILKEAGRNLGDFSRLDGQFTARSIHPDGTIIPLVIPRPKRILGIFPGTEEQPVATALPDVTVGSIVEYFFRASVDFYAPIWILQKKYFVHDAHFSLEPFINGASHLRWAAKLPPGAAVNKVGHRLEVNLTDVPPAPGEDFMPPFIDVVYNVRFFYDSETVTDFWGFEGLNHKRGWDNFCNPDYKLKAVVQSLIQPSDSDTVKLRKLYQTVQSLENTDYTRQRTQKEEDRSRVKLVRDATDLWALHRGTSFQLTYLFVAFARAAGFEADPMAIASRNQATFDRNVLYWDQLDSIIANVVVDGHRIGFDPGVPRCPFGHLAPWHEKVTGIAVMGKQMAISTTQYDSSQGSRIDRSADLSLDPTGAVTGTIDLTYSGTAGLPLRLAALLEDEQFVRTEIESILQKTVPSGVDVKIQSVSGLTDGEAPLTAKLTVTGRLGVATSRRLIIPAQFFASNATHTFASETRTTPVAFPERYFTHDQMNLTLPSGLAIETMPKSRSIAMPSASLFRSNLQPPDKDKSVLVAQRSFSLERLDYPTVEYKLLRSYYSQIADADSEQIILSTGSASTAKQSGQ